MTQKHIASLLTLLGLLFATWLAVAPNARTEATDGTEVLSADVGLPPYTVEANREDGAMLVQEMNMSHFVFVPVIQVEPVETCSLNAEEMAIFMLAENEPGQGRTTMICDPILSQVARAKALDMGTRGYFDHTDPDGFGPNYRVREAGYNLPNWYGSSQDSNNIESIAAGYGTPTAAWEGWMNSAGHRSHLLAELSFYADQTYYGIGYAEVPGSPYRHYWVFVTAPPR